ncbi:RRM (RNA recognition motif) superfamily domain-containing protein [Histoplasma ohiense]
MATLFSYKMSEKARGYWRENPPNFPYTAPAIVASNGDSGASENDLLGHKRGRTHISSDGYKFSASEYEFCSDYGSISVPSDATLEEETEKFPDFVDSGFNAHNYLPAPNGSEQYHVPQYLPLQLAGYTYYPCSIPEQKSTGYQVGYNFYPSVPYLPRYSPYVMKASHHFPMLDQGLGIGQNGGLNGNFKEYEYNKLTGLAASVVSMGHTKNLSAVNPNAVGANRHFVGVTETMRQKGGDVLSSVTLATSMEHDPSFLTARTFQLPSDHNYATQHQNPAPAASPMTATTAMAVTMSASHNGPYGYAGNPVCYPYAMPFDNGARYSLPPRFGVIKITNIPYAVTKHEILQFLGRNARPLTPDLGCPVHIIMERSTGKTMDCYIEFPTKADAECTLAWVNRSLDTCQTPKLGNRHVVVRASNQDELLKDLFPRAKNIDWRNGIPHVRAGIEKYCSGFQGFLTGEEIFCTVRHAEMPQRVCCNNTLGRCLGILRH